MSSNPASSENIAYTQPARSCEEIALWISTEIARALEIDVNAVDTSKEFSSFGIDSMIAFSLTGDICEWLGQDLPATLLWEYRTVDSLSQHIAERLNGAESESVTSPNAVLLSDGDKQRRLIAICGINLYQNLADQLRSRLDTYGVYVAPERTIGKFGKEIDDRYAYKTVEELAARYVDEITSIDPNGPYNLVGLSFGGVLAFEAARQLTRNGAEVSNIVLLDSVLTAAVRVNAYRHALQLIKSVVTKSDAQEMPQDSEAGSMSLEEMVRYRGRYYWTLGKQYEPSPYPGNVLLVRATATKLFGKGYIIDEQLGWNEQVSGSLETVRINATHTGILEPPHVAELSAVLQQRLSV